ncbi:hypothetical protein R1sor_004957 [Riccia sorocarpa]|uniref:Uncharacterized protein n=1 Tax=Riccia sorocarpa TaxID=122646 RepID=A0ABD3HK53_9MARC
MHLVHLQKCREFLIWWCRLLSPATLLRSELSYILWNSALTLVDILTPFQTTEESKQTCEVCQGLGFRICDYCQGEKVNVPVKGRATRFHRRCPECRAVGIMMCYRCKVFKCVTFPDWDDGSLVKQKQ